MHRLLLLLPLALVGCASAAQIAEHDDKVCQSYGAMPGTDTYVNCRIAREHERRADTRAVIAAPTAPTYQPTCNAMGACQ